MTGPDRLAARASVEIRTYAVAELVERLDGRLVGDGEVEIAGVNAIDAAGANEMTFISDEKHAHRWRASGAAAAIVSEGVRVGEAGASGDSRPLIFVADAELAMATLLALFCPGDDAVPAGVHPSAWIDETVSVPASARIGPHVSVGRGCRIGADVTLHPGVRLYEEVEVGDGSVLHANCVVRARCRLGRRVILHQNVSIGCDGFGYRPGPAGGRGAGGGGGGLVKITHVGDVVIEDEVEIGAGSCVDRAKFGSTVVGAGTKIDNLVQIAHNCRIGRCCVIAALTGLSGSVTVGDGVRIAGGVGVADHIHIGSGSSIGGQTGIIRDVPDGATLLGLPAAPLRDTLRQWSAISKLPSLIQRLGSAASGSGEGPAEGDPPRRHGDGA